MKYKKRKTREMHGLRYTKAYTSWQMMKSRCLNKDLERYNTYGAVNIIFQKEWEYFGNFYNDMGPRPDGTTLDRIDNSKGYTKENCRCSTKKEQNNNRSWCKKITINELTKTALEWSKISGTKYKTILCRYSNGWSDYESVYGRMT